MVSIDTSIKESYTYLGTFKKEPRDSELNKLYPNLNFIVEEKKSVKKYLGKTNELSKEKISMEIRKMNLKQPIKIADLRDKLKDFTLIATITFIQPIREWNSQKVTSARLQDDTGECNLDLWNDDINKFQVGDKIRIIDGYAKEKMFTDNGELIHIFDLTKGRYGMLRKVGD